MAPGRRDVVPPQSPSLDWGQFLSATSPPVDKLISVSSVGNLRPFWSVALPEVSDGCLLLVRNVQIDGDDRDLLIAGTTAGRVVAIDATNGTAIWQTSPPGGPRWTTSS